MFFSGNLIALQVCVKDFATGFCLVNPKCLCYCFCM